MKLAAISGVNGVFSDEDIARVRELALGGACQKSADSPKSGGRQPGPQREQNR